MVVAMDAMAVAIHIKYALHLNCQLILTTTIPYCMVNISLKLTVRATVIALKLQISFCRYHVSSRTVSFWTGLGIGLGLVLGSGLGLGLGLEWRSRN